VGEALRRDAPPIAALSALAVSQPLLDLFGRNPEFFVAQDMTATEVVVFGAVIALGVPLVLMGAVAVAAALSARAGRVAHAAVLGLLAGAFSLVLLGRRQESTVVAAALAIAVGSLAVVLVDRHDWLRTTLRYLSPLPVLVLALFVFGSDTARLVWSPQAAAAPAEVVAVPAPVSLLIFDEVPLASLLREDGSINAARFPNFARLADAGTWYRNATSPLPRTEAAVPSVLSGTIDPGAIPSTIDYPRNLFTMLAGSHVINAEEEVTALCPDYACGAGRADGTGLDRTTGSLADAAVVYGHRTLPAAIRADLPPVNQSWGDFGDAAEGDAHDPFAARRDDPSGTQTQVGKLAYFDRMIDRIAAGPEPGLNVAHGVFPHAPWTLTPDGDAYGSVTEGLEFEPHLVWADDEELVVQGQIQHLLQLGAADAAVGRLIDRLEATDQWEESLVAVVADHGAAFEPGGLNREPTMENLDEIFRVPMIVKYPGQRTGVVDDDPAQLTDLLPTITDALEVETAWAFDGRSLLAGDRSDRTPTAVLRDGTEIDLDPDLEPLLDLARRNHERFPYRDDWLGVVALGDHGAEVGRQVSSLDVGPDAGWTWATDRWAAFDDVGDGFVPIQFTGTVSGPGGSLEPDAILVAVNGTVAGVGMRVTGAADDSWTFSTIVAAELFRTGANAVELLVRDPRGTSDYTPVAGARDATMDVVVDEGGRPTSVVTGGAEIEILGADDRRVEIDDAFTDGRTLIVDGWAADTDVDEAPTDIALIVDGRRVSAGVDPYPALAEPTGPLAEWGFRLSVPAGAVEAATEGTVLAVFDDVAVAVAVSWR
jgi:hypothetical protein